MFDKENIRIHWLKTSEKIRDFLFSDKSRQFLVFLFFVFLSSCFWLLQVLNEDYETELSLPLRMENVPGNVVMTSELPKELHIGVKDRGTVLANYLLGQTFYPVKINFEDYADKGTHVRIPVSALGKKISSQLNQSTKLQTVRPDTLEFIYAEGQAKKVPVRFQGSIGVERQFYVSSVSCMPDSVMVYAPQAILDTITAAYTQKQVFENVSDTVNQRVKLTEVKGAKFTPAFTDVRVLVDIYAEKTVELPVRPVNFPPDKTLRTFPSKVKATFQIGLSQFRAVTADDFFVGIDYEDLLKNKGEKCPVHLGPIPGTVKHIRLHPREVEYIIEQNHAVQ